METMTIHERSLGIPRRLLLAGVAAASLFSAVPLLAQDVSGELVIMQWQGGVEADLWKDLEAAFVAKNPGVTIRELVMTGQGDMRGPMRTALLGGEVVDLIINTWPAFRAELNDAGVLRPIDDQWAKYDWSSKLNDSWKALGQIDGTTFGLTYTYGDRSGVWYKPSHLEKAGISAPATWEEFLASFDKLKAAGYTTPVAIGAKYWSHTEWFESLLLRTAGVETASKLAAHDIPWTDPAVKGALQKYAEMLNAGCCGDPATMFANDWDGAADMLFKADTANYQVIGMWVNARARNDYGLTEGEDYSLFQFPSLGMGYDDTSSVDAKELNATSNGANPEAADAFLDFIVSKDAADILAGYGYASPSTAADPALLGPVQQVATAAVANSKVQFVLGDLLPGDLVDEYRVQLQKFLQDPSDANIDAVLAAIEAKAAEFD
jgi:ABC-type glycerol-3-phosphate transport system substrate-binding protein